MKKNTILCIVLVGSLLTNACTSVGPRRLPSDRIDYADAVASSWQRQMLLNVVKLRYGEMPMFLDVASVINQYTVEGSLAATVRSGATDDFGARGTYTDRPTVTYAPLTGEKFTRSLLPPL